MKVNSDKPKINKTLTKSANQFPVVGIGASAGGLDAFKKLLKAIPENSGMAYVLVQHLDPKHESLLPDLLQKVTNIPVLEITDDLKVEPDHIYILPSNKMMIANDGVLELSPRPEKTRNERNMPIDLFFASLAEVHQSHAIGVVLSGTASDGTLGLKAIKNYGGVTFAQDEASAAYEGMPHSAVQAGVVDFILSPDKIPQKLQEIIHKVFVSDDALQNIPRQEENVFKQILTILRLRKGTDFTYYKQTTIRRRILRRMAINKNEEPEAYLKYLRDNKAEQDVLYLDLLIPVTEFFRDDKIFDNLCEQIFPLILSNKPAGEPVRIWVAGCSTGEEAYSIAICFKELLSAASQNHADKEANNAAQKIQIFATDISEPAIAKARSGLYSKNDLTGLSQKQIDGYFTKKNGDYQANKSIRDMCVFAVHNFLKDPPFGKMDFISCRNVLIYMEPYLQKKALTTFHYALKPNGYLFLEKSETTSGVPQLFAAFGKKDKLFTRKDVPGSFIHTTTQRTEQSFTDMHVNSKKENARTDFQKTADDIMLSRYTPAGVVINEAMDIVHFRGSTGNFLEPAPGKASLNLLKMAKEGLPFELRNILHKAKKENAPVIKENIPIQVNGSLQNISIEAMPLPNILEPHFLVLFHENNSMGNRSRSEAGTTGNKKKTIGKTSNDDKDLRIKQLELELAQIREDMRSITEDQETVNEELQSANEELLSSSEELQSLNEEMETSKEELQSTNEELMVVNQEMIGLNEQVTEARDYAEAIIATVQEPLLVLDYKLRVKSANDAFYKTFQVNEKDTAHKLIYELGNKQWDIPALRIQLEAILPHNAKFENFEVQHSFPNIGERVMLLNGSEITRDNAHEKLILLSIEDITERKNAQEVLRKTSEHFRQLVKELPAAVYSCDAKGRINFYNDAAVKVWGREPEIGKELWCGSFKIFNPDGSPLPLDKSPMAIALKEGRAITGEEIIIERPDGTRSVVRVYPQPEFDLSGKIIGAINMGFDVTEQVNANKKIEESELRFRLMAELIPQKMWTADAAGNKNYFNKKWLEFSGLPFEKLKDWGWGKIVHPDDWEETKIRWQQSINTGKDFEMENRLKCENGKYLWHLTRAIALKDGDGKIKMWVGSKTEIQEQKEQKEELEKAVLSRTIELQDANKELEEKQQELLLAKEKLLTGYSRSLIEASLDPLITISSAGKITDMNEAFSTITGIARENLLDTDFGNYFTEPDKALNIYQEVFDKGFVMDYPLTIMDHKLTDVLFNGSVYKEENGKVLGAVVVARDITDQKRIETELIEAKVFAELAVAIAEEAKSKAEDAVKSKQQFLSNMSHEIRTPMNAIIGFTKVLLKSNLTSKQKEYLSAIKMSGDALIVLINDILDLAKVDAGKMTFEQVPFKMALSITSMLHLFETKIQEKNLRLLKEYDHNIPNVLLGDPVRLHQIILNLVSNAVKFTTKGDIKVSVRLLEEDDEKVSVEFAVSDTGIGIPEEKIEMIFDNFHQASSNTARLFGGTGLGLAIVKQLVEQQGGSIQVKSTVNEGSTFSFNLTFQKTKSDAEATTEILELDAEHKNIKVLVVEDMALNQLLMKTLLDDFGFERDIADNGRIAIEKLETKSYDIILMDLQMPEMNGFEATEYIRNTMNSKIPIIALTADVTTVDVAKCKAVGMNDYIAKPVDERVLYSKIIGLVKKPNAKKYEKANPNEPKDAKISKCIDLEYLIQRTKSNPALMMEMISLYLEQTPPLISAMRQSLEDKDWQMLHASVHKIIPSFLIMGIHSDYEMMARKVQEYANTQQQIEGIYDLVLQLENVCTQACIELTDEFNRIKKSSNG